MFALPEVTNLYLPKVTNLPVYKKEQGYTVLYRAATRKHGQKDIKMRKML